MVRGAGAARDRMDPRGQRRASCGRAAGVGVHRLPCRAVARPRPPGPSVAPLFRSLRARLHPRVDCEDGSDEAAITRSLCEAYRSRTGDEAVECAAATDEAALLPTRF